jgi:hypothetical protein
MWFKLISLALATLCLGKAVIALAAPQLFYRLRLAQYGSTRLPWTIFLAPTYVLALTALAWYATVFHYAPWGWLLTLFLTLVGALAVVNLLRWSQHRAVVAAAITERPIERATFDAGLGVLGAVFIALALFVY